MILRDYRISQLVLAALDPADSAVAQSEALRQRGALWLRTGTLSRAGGTTVEQLLWQSLLASKLGGSCSGGTP